MAVGDDSNAGRGSDLPGKTQQPDQLAGEKRGGEEGCTTEKNLKKDGIITSTPYNPYAGNVELSTQFKSFLKAYRTPISSSTASVVSTFIAVRQVTHDHITPQVTADVDLAVSARLCQKPHAIVRLDFTRGNEGGYSLTRAQIRDQIRSDDPGCVSRRRHSWLLAR